MTAPAVLARATGRTGSSDVAAHDITLPAGINAGERLLVCVAVDEGQTFFVDEGYSGSAWQNVGQGNNSFSVGGAVFTKIAEGGDLLRLRISSTSPLQQSSHVSFRIGAANMVEGANANGSSTNSDPPEFESSAHAGSPDVDVLWIVFRAGDSTVVASALPSTPSAFSNQQSIAAAGAGGASCDTGELSVQNGHINPGTFTSNTEQWVAWTLAVYNWTQAVARVTQQVAEVVSNEIPAARITQLVVEIVSTNVLDDPAVGNVGGQLVIAT